MQKILSESVYSKLNENELKKHIEVDDDKEVYKVNGKLPEFISSFLSRYPRHQFIFKRGLLNTILFRWLDPIFQASNKGEYITDNEINKADDDKDIRMEYEYFIKNWKEEFSKPESKHSLYYSTYKVILKTFFLRIISILSLKLIHDIIHTIRPWQIKGILAWINDPNGTRSSGIFRFMLIVVFDIISGSLLQQYFRESFSLSIMLKGVMNYALSHKLVKLPKRIATSNMPKCISFFSSESTHILDTGNAMLAVPSMIFQNILLLISLYKFIGVSAFIGYIIIALSLFLNGFLLRMTQLTRNKYINSMNDRISLSSEFVHSFKQIKCYAWESYYLKNITSVREKELKNLSIWRFYNQFCYVLASLGISISPVISFGSFFLFTRTFPVDIIFTSILVFELLQVTMVLLPRGLSSLQKIANTYTRLSDFLLLDEIEPREMITDPKHENDAVIFDDVSFNYQNNDCVLKSINLIVRKKETVGIIGSVGSGKTTIIELILNEIKPTSGSVNSNGSVFYCPQTSWVTNNTIRDNIILDLPYDKKWYDEVVNACSLIYDFKAMPSGDLTMIGENGINLSGGQKQRISLARAVYQNPDIFILDDVFSALDNIVANNIFQECILGLLKDKTIILATNKLDVLTHLDKVAFISNKELSYFGPPTEKLFSHPEFRDFLINMNKIQSQINQIIDDVVPIEEIEEINNNSDQGDSNNKLKISNTITSMNISVNSMNSDDNLSDSNINNDISPSNASRRGSRLSLSELRVKYERESKSKLNDNLNGDDQDKDKSLVSQNSYSDNGKYKFDSNKLNKNKIDFSLYLEYIKQIKYGIFVVSVICTYLCSISMLSTSFWLSSWSKDMNKYKISTGILIFFLLSILQPIFILLFKFTNIYMTNNASKRIYSELLMKLTFSRLSFYESIPIGVILSRITSDVVSVDELLPQNLSDLLFSMSRVTIFIGYFIFLDYKFLFLFLTLLFLFVRIKDQALNANRQLKRIFHRRSSPILSSVSHTIEGISVIRCSNCGLDNFLKRMQYLIDYESAPWRCFCLVQRWMGIHIDLLGACIVSSLGIFCVLAKNNLSVGSIGIAFQCSSSLTQLVLWMIRTAAETENNFLSFERVRELIEKTAQEQNIDEYNIINDDQTLYNNDSSKNNENKLLNKPTNHKDQCSDSLLINIDNSNLIVKDWPKEGNIKFENVVLQYNISEPPVINDLTLSIKGGTKVGICGRTGSGKSSLLSTILRLYDIEKGRILIDGVDISKVSLKQLRSLVTIIPQEPNILTGTLRYNLDPHNKFTDDDIKEALVHSNSISFVNSLPDGINTQMSGVFSNISIGQKQLICLARALLRKSKIILFDEATSSVDIATDNIIQNIVKKHFSNCTILSIAHRVHTIIDFDYIIVLDKGRVIEYDTPHNLLSNTSSVFYSIVNEINAL
ncbi:hypothetical protein FG379_000887 [Cryptosporidium bovis]|uniref:uncharacterized protein n=1 Tax=Cryptosporidium bovis TaxID=310047 RepID=UPI00351A258B|nr:hypothetical protein FG379_000887 [Cryptosporidium bovis]